MKKIIVAVLSIALMSVSTVTANAKSNKDLKIVVDGVVSAQTIRAETIEDVVEELDHENLEVLEGKTTDKVEDGDTIRLASEKKISLTINEERKEVTTNAITVQDLIEEEKIEDIKSVNVSRDTKLENGINVIIETEEKKLIETEEDINYKTETKYDFSMKVGEEKKKEGKKGKKLIRTYYYTDNGEVNSEYVNSLIIKRPENEIITKGSKLIETEDIDYNVKHIEDDTIEVGKEIVKTEGKKGKKEVTYKKENDKKEKVSEKIITKPVDKVVRVGTKQETVSYTNNTSDNERTITIDSNSAKEEIARRESGGSYTAYNPAGGYYGRYQLNPSLVPYGASPEEQEIAADNYVANRYGSWENALNFWNNNGWY